MADNAFSKFKSSVNRGIATISVKTSSSLEKSKLKTHMDSLKNEIQKQYFEIGEMAYNLWLNKDPDNSALIAKFEDIKAKQTTITELSAQLESIDERDNQILGTKTEKPVAAGYTCPQCGAGYETPVRFCRSCGFKMGE